MPFPGKGWCILLAVAGGFGVVEVGARLLVRARVERKGDLRELVAYDAHRGWALRPNTSGYTGEKPVRINAAGFRDREFSLAPEPGVTRIACIGDAATFGWGVPLEESFPKQLERELRVRDRFEVLNFGVGGQDARQARYTLTDLVAPYEPKVVIYGMSWHDLIPTDLEHVSSRWLEARLAPPRRSFLHELVHASRALSFVLDQDCGAVPEPCLKAIVSARDSRIADLWEGEKNEVAAMRDSARAIGAELAVLVWPVKARVTGEALCCRFEENATALGRELGVPIFTALPAFEIVRARGEDPYFPRDDHPSAAAYAETAHVMASAIAGSIAR
jgi:hypothetical protein